MATRLSPFCVALACAALSGILGVALGRALERHEYSIAPPALREVWQAKEGSLRDRLAHSDRAIMLDRHCLLAYVWKARAWYESDEQAAPSQVVATLKEGMAEAGVDDALYLLYRVSLEEGDEGDARLYRDVLARVGGDWATL